MVFYFKLKSGLVVYMGKDKFENEELIRFAWPEDVWFHVEGISSAHVYLRLAGSEFLFTTIPDEDLITCAKLVKGNSIEGSKKEYVDICYTRADNLKKSSEFEIGQVSFHDKKLVKILKNIPKDSILLKELNKGKIQLEPDLQEELNMHLNHLSSIQKQKLRASKEIHLAEKKEKEKEEAEKQKQINDFNSRICDESYDFL